MNKIPVVLISGDDDVLISRSLNEHIGRALGDEDRTLALEELTEANYLSSEQFNISKLVDSAQTAPFYLGVLAAGKAGSGDPTAAAAPRC